jgi:outer membrane protein assembly factor BamB
MKLLFAFAALWCLTLAPVRSTDWPTFGFDSARSSYNSAEKVLSKANVAQLHELWQISLGNVADSTPILLAHVHAGSQNLAVLFQTTKGGTTYAVEAKSGTILWKYATSGPGITTSTPVADMSRGVLFVPGVDGYVHELNPATGAELTGTGFPAQITLIPNSEKDASSLNLANGYLYATTSGYIGDAPPYDGHVVAVRLKDGKTTVFNSLCSNLKSLPTASSCPEQRSGIWARSGAVVDPDPSMQGRVYASTGNGEFNATRGGEDYGDSILSLKRNLSQLLDYYTPGDNRKLDDDDVDLGSTAAVMLPTQPNSATPLMMVQAGKDGKLRLLDRTHLGGINGEMQKVTLPDGVWSAPAVWTDSSGTAHVYIGFSNSLQSYVLETNSSGVSRIHARWSAALSGTSQEGTSPVVANGMVFVATGGAIEAFDAMNGKLLWSSAQSGSGGSIGAIHWQSPIVVDGSVYCSDENGNLTAYALPASQARKRNPRQRR